jgi:hypothetical protein
VAGGPHVEAIPGAAHRAAGETDAKLAQKLGELQAFMAVFPQECMGRLAPFANLTPFSLQWAELYGHAKVGLNRMVVSETHAPNMSVNLV